MRSRAKPFRILLIVENVPLARDHRLQKQVGSLLAHGYRVSVICRRDPDNGAFPGIDLLEYDLPGDAQSKAGFIREYGISWTSAARLALKSFVSEPFDAIQISGTPDIYFAIAAPFRLLGRPLILDQRDLSPELYEARYGKRDRIYRTLLRCERASYRAADHIITVNETLRTTIARRGGVPLEKITVVGNGPRLAHCESRPPLPELKHGKRFLACWVGMMNPQDSVDVALQAVAHLVHTHNRTDCHFAFIGEGDTRASCQDLARELGIDQYVSFPGWLPEEQVFRYLATADIGLEPNLEEIVSPVKGMEYMAFALPFVAFDLPETRQLAGEAAAYAPRGDVDAFADLLDDLLNDGDLRAQMGQAGRRRVEETIAWENQEGPYLTIYRRLLGTPDAPRQSVGVAARLAATAPAPVRDTLSHTRARTRLRVRTRLAESPRLYLPFARRKYPGPSPQVVGADTELLIEAYTRCATTFAVYALQLAQERPVRLAHHLHAPAQVIEAVRRGIPALVLIREPRATILSQLVREPNVVMADALYAYARFYESLLPYAEGFVVGEFAEVTNDFAAVVRRVNQRFGTDFVPFVATEENLRECFALIESRGALSPVQLGFESGLVSREEVRAELERLRHRRATLDTKEAWMPSEQRQAAKEALAERWQQPQLASARERAQRIYTTFVQLSARSDGDRAQWSARSDGDRTQGSSGQP